MMTWSGAALAQPLQLPTDLSRLLQREAICSPAPDPSAVFGYFSFVDPATGELHVPYSTAYGAPSAIGYPSYNVQFRSRVNPSQTFDVRHDANAGLSQYNGPSGAPIALSYHITLNADRRAGNPTGQVRITYNPDQWCFWTITTNNTGAPYNTMQMRAEPLPGLPDPPSRR